MRELVPIAIAQLAGKEQVKQYDRAYWTRHVRGQFAKLTGSAKSLAANLAAQPFFRIKQVFIAMNTGSISYLNNSNI